MSVSLVGLTLHVQDVDRSLDFYKRLPNSSVLFHKSGRFALLRLGSGRLGLVQDQQRPFHVEIDCQDLDATHALLKESGFETEGPISRAWGDRDVLLVDPDCNLVEFRQARKPKRKDPGRVASFIALPLALISLVLAALIRCLWPHLCGSLGYGLVAAWVIFPPVWFWAEWVFLSEGQDKERLKHTHDLARNIWLALVVVLAAIIGIKWPPGS